MSGVGKMSFHDELEEIKEFFYVSQMRYITSNKYLEHLQKVNKNPTISEKTIIYFGKEPPIPPLKNYEYTINVEDYKSSLDKHIKLLINNCIILLVSFWELYCTKNKINKYYNGEITEVILYRNCIIHNKGKVDKAYVKNSKLKIFKLGELLNFNKEDFERFLAYFEDK